MQRATKVLKPPELDKNIFGVRSGQNKFEPTLLLREVKRIVFHIEYTGSLLV